MTLFILTLVCVGVAILILSLNWGVSPNEPDPDKDGIYECGFETIFGQVRAPFTIIFYLVSVLFLSFDLEILLIYPLTVTLSIIEGYGFSISVLFFIILTLGFVIEVSTGVLKFADQRSTEDSETVLN